MTTLKIARNEVQPVRVFDDGTMAYEFTNQEGDISTFILEAVMGMEDPEFLHYEVMDLYSHDLEFLLDNNII